MLGMSSQTGKTPTLNNSEPIIRFCTTQIAGNESSVELRLTYLAPENRHIPEIAPCGYLPSWPSKVPQRLFTTWGGLLAGFLSGLGRLERMLSAGVVWEAGVGVGAWEDGGPR